MRRRLTRRCSRPAAGDAHELVAQPRAAGLLNGRLVSRRNAGWWRLCVFYLVTVVSCSRENAAPSYQLALPLPAHSVATGHRFRLVVDHADPFIEFFSLPQVVELTSTPAGSPAEPWAVVSEEPSGTQRNFAPVWREQQDGSLTLRWGGEDTSTTVSVLPQGGGRWVGTVTHRWFDGSSDSFPAQLEQQS